MYNIPQNGQGDYTEPMRKRHDKAFKAKVALESLKEDKTIQELARQYEIHPSQVLKWKKKLIEGVTDLFERPNKKSPKIRQAESERDTLLKTIDDMKIENDFLKKILTTIRKRTFLVDPDYKELSVSKQCRLLKINRATFYYRTTADRES